MSAAIDTGSIAETLKKFAPLLVGGAAIGSGALGLELPPWAVRSLEQWGPAAALMLLVVWYVPRSAIQDFIVAQQNQAVALTSVAENIKALPQKDHMKFDEIIVGQQMIVDQMNTLTGRLDSLIKAPDAIRR